MLEGKSFHVLLDMPVHHMLRHVGGPENVPQLIANVKARKEKLYGYGHRV